ncbi:MAG: hypothetical protein ACPGD5_05395 [Salibacteraceae bacterium]
MRVGAIFILVCFVFGSCTKTEYKEIDFGYDYYPISVNDYKTFTVDCLVYNDFTLTTDTFNFFIKDLVKSKKLDEGGRTVYRIERYRKDNQTDWEIQKVWTSVFEGQFVEEQFDNIRTVKLAFPVRSGYSWDGNARNILESEDFTYSSNTIDTVINNVTLKNTRKIEHYYKTDPLQIETAIAYEHYTLQIGLVNRFETFVKRFTTGVPGEPVIDSGYAVSYNILDYYVQ